MLVHFFLSGIINDKVAVPRDYRPKFFQHLSAEPLNENLLCGRGEIVGLLARVAVNHRTDREDRGSLRADSLIHATRHTQVCHRAFAAVSRRGTIIDNVLRRFQCEDLFPTWRLSQLSNASLQLKNSICWIEISTVGTSARGASSFSFSGGNDVNF